MATTNSFTTWPALLPESAMTLHPAKPRRGKPARIKLLNPPTPPDEKTILKLNELATKSPFCNSHKVKKHELF
ncbi:MAG TPA: hypothetical protein VI233_05370 [Puia sp.]